MRIDEATNPFKCKSDLLVEILQNRLAQQLVKPAKRRLDRRMKGAGPDPQGAFG